MGGGGGGGPCQGVAGEEAAGPEVAQSGWSKSRRRGASMEAAAVELPREDREDRDAGWLLRRRTPYEGEGVGPGSAGSRAGTGSIEAAPEGGQAVSRDGGAAREDGRAWPLGTALDRGGSCSEGAVAALFLCSSEWTWLPSDSQMELMPRRAAALARRKSAGGGARSSIMSGERERGGAARARPGAPTGRAEDAKNVRTAAGEVK